MKTYRKHIQESKFNRVLEEAIRNPTDCFILNRQMESCLFDGISEDDQRNNLRTYQMNTKCEARTRYKGFVYVREVELGHHKNATTFKFKRAYWRYKVKPATAFRVDHTYYSQGDSQ